MDIAAAPDGGVIVVGQRVAAQGTAWFVIRLRSNGARDTSFGGDGLVVTDFGPRYEHATTVAIGSNGRILVAGSVTDGANESWAFARYLPGGALDPSFGGDGRVTMSLSSSRERVQDLVVRSTGILAAGYAESRFVPRFAITKLHLDGTRATTFGHNGVKVVNIGAGADLAFGLTVQADGRPVLAGYASDGGRADWGVVRLHAGGARDGSFGGRGVVTTAFTPAYEIAASLAMQPDGRILVVGRARGPSGTDDLAVVRYRADGRLNRIFSGDGKALFNPFGEDDEATDVAVHGGRIIVVGMTMQNLVPRMVVLRIRMN